MADNELEPLGSQTGGGGGEDGSPPSSCDFNSITEWPKYRELIPLTARTYNILQQLKKVEDAGRCSRQSGPQTGGWNDVGIDSEICIDWLQFAIKECARGKCDGDLCRRVHDAGTPNLPVLVDEVDGNGNFIIETGEFLTLMVKVFVPDALIGNGPDGLKNALHYIGQDDKLLEVCRYVVLYHSVFWLYYC